MSFFTQQRFTLIVAYLVLVAILAAGVWSYGLRQALGPLEARGKADLALTSDRLMAQIFRYRDLAVLLAEHPTLIALHDGGDAQAAQDLLQEAADKIAAYSLSYTDIDGQILARTQVQPVRAPSDTMHFQRALDGALGVDHGVDGQGRIYNFAAPSFGPDGKVRGVLLVSADIDRIEFDWRGAGPPVWFVDRDGGAVFITNRSEILFWQASDPGLVPAHGARPPLRQRYVAGFEMWETDWGDYIPSRALHLTRDLAVVDLKAEALIDVAPAYRLAGLQAAVAAAICLVLGAFLFMALERRRTLALANQRLESRVADRTAELSDANTALRHEVKERQDAEAALRKAQADLVQAGKLSALGQMSAGISHELNQPLMAIQQYAENGGAFLDRDKPEKAAENLSRIGAMAARAARIIRNLRAFARNESEPMGQVDLVRVVESAVELTTPRLRADQIALNWDAPDVPIWVKGGEVRLGQVLVNLITNAADAMSDLDDRRIEILVTQGTVVSLSVRDTGPGISEPEKMFDPFYSTKPVGSDEGMGLGLSISYGLVQSFGGRIHGQNAPGGGALLTVELEPWDERAVA